MACNFSIYIPPTQPDPVAVGEAALAEISEMEDLLTVYRGDSPMCQVNATAFDGPVRVDARMFAVLARAAELHAMTDGAFDITAGALIKAWGFFRGPRRVPSPAEQAEALARTGMQHVRLDPEAMTVRFDVPGLEFNLGAIGKGYAIDRAIARIRREFNVTCALMQGGSSSVYALGAPDADPRGWLVGIDHPYDRDLRIATVRLRDRAMGTTGTDNQYFEYAGRRYGHVIDPRKGEPADELASVTVLAPDAATADALSTALFVMGLDKARDFCHDHPEISAILVLKPGPDAGSRAAPGVVTLNLSPLDVTIGATWRNSPVGTVT